MNVRRLVLDVDKGIGRPDVLAIAEAIESVPGVEGVNVTVSEIDLETVGMDITVEGDEIDHRAVMKRIEATGAVVHSIDQICAGRLIVERVERAR
jgi:hypothetical protein